MTLKLLKQYVPMFYSSMVPDINKSRHALSFLPQSQVEVMVNLCRLIMETDFTSYSSKLYVQNKSYSYGDISSLTNEPYNTIKTRIRNDNNKIEKYLGNPLVIITDKYSNLDELNELNSVILRLIAKYEKKKFDPNVYLAVPIPYTEYVESYEVPDEKFDELALILNKISRKTVSAYLSKLSKEDLGYLYRLLNNPYLDGADKKRRERLIDLLTD